MIRKPSPRNPLQKKPKVEVKLERRGEETYVLCRGEGRVEKDRAIRGKQEQRLIADHGHGIVGQHLLEDGSAVILPP